MPVATMAIGNAKNAGLLAARILALKDAAPGRSRRRPPRLPGKGSPRHDDSGGLTCPPHPSPPISDPDPPWASWAAASWAACSPWRPSAWAIASSPWSRAPTRPAARSAIARYEADYADRAALRELAAACDAITYEFENIDARRGGIPGGPGQSPCVPAAGCCALPRTGCWKSASSRTPASASPPSARWNRAPIWQIAGREVGYPAFLKTARGGYDGKGQAPVPGPADAAAAFDRLYPGRAL